MKTIAALIAGVLLSITTFFAGLLTALVYFNAGQQPRSEGLDTAMLWTDRPVTVDRNPRSFERLPARPVSGERQVAALDKAGEKTVPGNDAAMPETDPAVDEPQAMVDPVTTGAVDPLQPDAAELARAEQALAHVEWCARRYRSYRPGDNTYRPYGGGRRPCQSPYSGIVAADMAPENPADGGLAGAEQSPDGFDADEGEAALEQASFHEDANAYATDDHVRSCLRRYRSYRPEDNTYQPFTGGPRRQCR